MTSRLSTARMPIYPIKPSVLSDYGSSSPQIIKTQEIPWELYWGRWVVNTVPSLGYLFMKMPERDFPLHRWWSNHPAPLHKVTSLYCSCSSCCSFPIPTSTFPTKAEDIFSFFISKEMKDPKIQGPHSSPLQQAFQSPKDICLHYHQW